MNQSELVIDAGNSSLKAGIYEDGVFQKKHILSYKEDTFDQQLKLLTSQEYARVGLISVKGDTITNKIATEVASPLIVLHHNSTFPFNVAYQQPESLGIDRIVGCAGAMSLNKNKGNLLVIDAGTCITYDFIDEKDQYIGGAISPGRVIRARSLTDYTDKLPLIETTTSHLKDIGTSTKGSIASGIVNGIRHEMNGFISDAKKANPQIKVFLTGGDAFFFEDALKCSIFAQDNLILTGIYELMKINA